MSQTVANIAAQHILKDIPSPKPSDSLTSPLFVALQGPQGIGKTTVTKALVSQLSSPPHSLRVIGLSIDDLYLGYEALQKVTMTHEGNTLLQGRGQPGTHDVTLGAEILQILFNINQPDAKSLRIPVYDKSLHDGQGDRLPFEQWAEVKGPIDVVLLEGWCLGFYPTTETALGQIWEKRMEFGMPTSLVLLNGLQDLQDINENLAAYVELWYPYFSCFIQIASTPMDGLEVIYKWRLQQEHNMKAANGGRGMTDEQVARFIDRYIPGYIFFGDGPIVGYGRGGSNKRPPWAGHGLKIVVDQDRHPVGQESF